jgi:hypothetical protein
MGGIATYYQSLLSSSLSEKVNLRFVQTSAHDRELAQSGRATFANSSIMQSKIVVGFSEQSYLTGLRSAILVQLWVVFYQTWPLCVIARIFRRRVLLHPHCSLSAVYSDRPGWWRWMFRQ